RARADRDRLHPDVRVDGAADQLLLEERHRPRLERADAPHLEEQLLERADVECRGGSGHQSAITAIGSPTRTSSPSTARIASSTPSAGASTSCVTFSASTSTITSPAATASPSCLSQRAIVPYSCSSETRSSLTSTATAAEAIPPR